MYILAIETTGKEGSVCLVQKDEGGGEPAVLGEKRIEGSMSHLKELIPSISSLLESQGVSKNEISYIAASVGPGSFTGIRIGVATARALSQAFGLEYAIAVPTLTAFQYKEQAAEAGAKGITVCAIINARRGQVYGMVDGYLADGPYMLTDVLEVIRSSFLRRRYRCLRIAYLRWTCRSRKIQLCGFFLQVSGRSCCSFVCCG